MDPCSVYARFESKYVALESLEFIQLYDRGHRVYKLNHISIENHATPYDDDLVIAGQFSLSLKKLDGSDYYPSQSTNVVPEPEPTSGLALLANACSLTSSSNGEEIHRATDNIEIGRPIQINNKDNSLEQSGLVNVVVQSGTNASTSSHTRRKRKSTPSKRNSLAYFSTKLRRITPKRISKVTAPSRQTLGSLSSRQNSCLESGTNNDKTPLNCSLEDTKLFRALPAELSSTHMDIIVKADPEVRDSTFKQSALPTEDLKENSANSINHAADCADSSDTEMPTVYRCRHCSVQLLSLRSMELHCVEDHNQLTPYSCKICGFRTGWHPKMRSHLKSFHPGASFASSVAINCHSRDILKAMLPRLWTSTPNNNVCSEPEATVRLSRLSNATLSQFLPVNAQKFESPLPMLNDDFTEEEEDGIGPTHNQFSGTSQALSIETETTASSDPALVPTPTKRPRNRSKCTKSTPSRLKRKTRVPKRQTQNLAMRHVPENRTDPCKQFINVLVCDKSGKASVRALKEIIHTTPYLEVMSPDYRQTYAYSSDFPRSVSAFEEGARLARMVCSNYLDQSGNMNTNRCSIDDRGNYYVENQLDQFGTSVETPPNTMNIPIPAAKESNENVLDSSGDVTDNVLEESVERPGNADNNAELTRMTTVNNETPESIFTREQQTHLISANVSKETSNATYGTLQKTLETSKTSDVREEKITSTCQVPQKETPKITFHKTVKSLKAVFNRPDQMISSRALNKPAEVFKIKPGVPNEIVAGLSMPPQGEVADKPEVNVLEQGAEGTVTSPKTVFIQTDKNSSNLEKQTSPKDKKQINKPKKISNVMLRDFQLPPEMVVVSSCNTGRPTST